MSDTKVNFEEAATKRDADAKNDKSTIEFPYADLDDGVDVARGIYARAGLGTCEVDELAAQLGQTLSGSFRLKTAAAKIFGLVDKGGRSEFRLSALGQQVVRDDTAPEARAIAFCNVPLFKAIFEKYRGHLLPPLKALEREMSALGVAPKQAAKARQSFERSARQAGFFMQGEDRLVQPRFDRQPETRLLESTAETKDERHGGGSGGGGEGPHHPLIVGLFQSLPKDGERWGLDDAVAWLEAAAVNLRLAYKFKGSVTVTPKSAANQTVGLPSDAQQ